MSRVASGRSSGQSKGAGAFRDSLPSDYLEVSRKPWPSLVFLLPLIVAYEVGTIYFARDAASGAETRIIAFTFLSKFLNLFGATGRLLPAAAVVGILLALHVAHRDRWRFRPGVLLGMLAECVCWTVPLLAMALMIARYLPLQGVPLQGVALQSGGEEVATSKSAMMVLSIGAGIYEELIFRLAAFAILSILLTDVLGMPGKRAGIVIVLSSAVLFSLYHYLGSEDPRWRTFVFRAVAGVFFGGLYLWRGFGITAGSHAAYDVAVQLIV